MSDGTAKETKAQRVERLKRELDPWQHAGEILRFAREGYASVPPEWLGTYFRWWGVYTQGDGVGAVGGKNGEGRALPYFMVRIRVPNGLLFSHQLRTIADLAEEYARGLADITVRENIQLHWVRIEDLPELFRRLGLAGLTTMGTCGDVTRNITGCPLAGVDADEIVDASPLVLAATRMLAGNPEFVNVPRKWKVSITGCRVWCSYPEINDVGMTAIRHPATGEIGFSVRVGGGLSADPRFATRLNAFVRWHQAVPVLRGITEIFPGPQVDSKKDIKDFNRSQAWGHHASGSAKIGADNDPMAVLDSRFRVRGTQGLRVVDASVFPKIPGYFIVVPIYMASEKAADVILQDAAGTFGR